MTTHDEMRYMRLAIREARRCEPEDLRCRPHVGVVVVRDEEILATACRGDLSPGDHAEYTVLEKKLADERLAGCTVYTTLEPCTTRNHPKTPCADRLIQRRVSRVVIGMLDPDQRISGKGILRLRRAGIAVDLFPPDLMSELEELNRDFVQDREADLAGSAVPGIAEAGITAFYPSRDYYGRIRRDAATIDRYVSTADASVIMVSINLMTGLPFNDLCACLKKKLSAGDFKATISLIDPRRSELVSVVAPVLNQEPAELAQSIQRSLRDLISFRKGLANPLRSRFDIRVHCALPFGSAILLDHQQDRGRIQIETKPYRAGLQRSIAFEVARTEPGGLFDVLVGAYEALLADGESFSPERE